MSDLESDSGSEFSGFSSFDDGSSDESDGEVGPAGPWTNVFTQPRIEPFTEVPGPNLPDTLDPATATPFEYFLLMFPVRLLTLIVNHTNAYAAWKMSQPGAAYDDKWQEVTVEEMRAFLAINILMGINQLPEADMFWSSNPLIGNSAVVMIMTCNRFQKIMQYLHVSDRAAEPARGDPGFDRLYKVRPVMDTVSATFRRYYTMSREVSIDEAMIAYSGRLSYRQYMPAKPIKRGIKVWMLADAQNSYLSKFDVYLGRQENRTEHGLGHNVILKMSEHLQHTHRWLFFDNLFTGIPLLESLLEVGLYGCGTVRVTRKGFPQELKKPATVRNRGDHKVLQKGDSNLIATVWKDSKLVYHLSTLSDPQEVLPVQRRSRQDVLHMNQPHTVYVYNKFMGGVDTQDQYRGSYSVGRNGKKPWRYIFWFLLNSCIVNAFILYDKSSTRLTKKKRFRNLDFRLELIQELIGGFNKRKRATPEIHNLGILTELENVNGHVHCRMPGKKRKCKFHSSVLKQRRETVYGCATCNVHLCQDGCHTRFHNQ